MLQRHCCDSSRVHISVCTIRDCACNVFKGLFLYAHALEFFKLAIPAASVNSVLVCRLIVVIGTIGAGRILKVEGHSGGSNYF